MVTVFYYLTLRTRKKKQNPLKNIAKCKFCDDTHHAKFQRVFRHLKATPFLAQSKNRLPRQHHHRTVFPPNRQSVPRSKTPFPQRPGRSPSIAVCSVSLPGTLSAEPVLPASSSRFSAGKTSASPSTARHGNTANPVSTSWYWP